ncbi:MAG: alpha/beta fold hydrolase [Pseudomonadota bacterium]
MLISIGTLALASCAVYVWARLNPSAATGLGASLLRRLAGFRKQQISVGDQVWPYLERGDRSATPVVMVHGFGADKDTWVGYGRMFDRSFRIVCPDLPGFGDATDTAFEDFSPRAQALRLLTFLDRCEIDEFHIVGSSMGGFIATWVALEAPDRARSLTLMNAAGVSGAEPSRMQPLVEAGESPLVATNVEELNSVLSMLSVRQMWLPKFVRQHLLNNYLRHGVLWRKIFDQLVKAQQSDRLKDQLQSIKAPTLVVWGDQDEILHVSCAEVFAQRIPDSRQLILKNVGHIPMFEAPLKTSEAQLQLMREAAATS